MQAPSGEYAVPTVCFLDELTHPALFSVICHLLALSEDCGNGCYPFFHVLSSSPSFARQRRPRLRAWPRFGWERTGQRSRRSIPGGHARLPPLVGTEERMDPE